MKVLQPEQLAGYQRDRVAESKARLPFRILGPVVIISFIGTLVSFVFNHPVLGLASLALCFGSATALVWLQSRKRIRKCERCHQRLEFVETDWLAEQYTGRKRKYPGLITGADGKVYYARSRRATGGTATGGTTYVIEQLKQRWWVCRNCRLCFLAVDVIREEFYKTKHHQKWKQAQELVKSDAGAVEDTRLYKL